MIYLEIIILLPCVIGILINMYILHCILNGTTVECNISF